jgi:hypothetical protein
MSVGDYKYFTVTHRQFKQAGDYFIKVLESFLVMNKYLKHFFFAFGAVNRGWEKSVVPVKNSQANYF